MQMMLKDGQLYIRQLDSVQYQIIKGWNKMKWSKQQQMLIGPADFDLLDRLSRMCKLPPNIEAERKRMEAVQIAVDDERMNEKPEPMVHFPVKMELFDHQCRGANMALLTFGLIEPPVRKHKCASCERLSLMVGCEACVKYGKEAVMKLAKVEEDKAIQGGRVVECKYYKKKEVDN